MELNPSPRTLFFLFLESGTASIYDGGLATSITNFQNPSYTFHFPKFYISLVPFPFLLLLPPTFSFAFSTHNSYHSSREKPNFHHQISYHNPITTSQHSNYNEHTKKKKLYTCSLLCC